MIISNAAVPRNAALRSAIGNGLMLLYILIDMFYRCILFL